MELSQKREIPETSKIVEHETTFKKVKHDEAKEG